MTALYSDALEHLFGPHIRKPSSIPMAWNDMTPSEQSMTLWFCKNHLNSFSLDEVARHAVAQTAQRNGCYDLETSNQIFSMFYDNKN